MRNSPNSSLDAADDACAEGSKITLDEKNDSSITFQRATLACDGKSLLHDLTATCPNGKLTIICGPVGSGKSTLLQAVAGEIDIPSGRIGRPSSFSRTAFCAQDPFIRTEHTIRDNIVFLSSLPFDAARYQKSLRACALDVDVAGFEQGDLRKAQGLSGGEAARVALARAVYYRPSHLLLDDVFCALDSITEEACWSALFGAEGLLRNTTVLLCSNDVKRFSEADHLVFLAGQSIAAEGSYDEVCRTSQDFKQFVDMASIRHVTATRSPNEAMQAPAKEITLASSRSAVDKEAQMGRLNSFASALLIFAAAAGWLLTAFMLVWGAICAAICGLGPSLVVVNWVKYPAAFEGWAWTGVLLAMTWVSHFYLRFRAVFTQFPDQSGTWLRSRTTLLQILLQSCMFLWWFLDLVYWPICGASNLHETQLHDFLNVSARRIHEYSKGFFLNRFSTDLFSVESEFSRSSTGTYFTGALILVLCALPAAASPITLVSFALLAIFIEGVRRLYGATSKSAITF
jgi:ATP-binding cassette subfamily C (CFTR/MRP) protein 1